jgi:hypothetical protein
VVVFAGFIAEGKLLVEHPRLIYQRQKDDRKIMDEMMRSWKTQVLMTMLQPITGKRRHGKEAIESSTPVGRLLIDWWMLSFCGDGYQLVGLKKRLKSLDPSQKLALAYMFQDLSQ